MNSMALHQQRLERGRKVGDKLEKLINSGKITSEELMSSFATLELHCLIMYLAFRKLRITFEEVSQSKP